MSEGKRVDVVSSQRRGMCVDLHLSCGHTLRTVYNAEEKARTVATCLECEPLSTRSDPCHERC